VNQRKPNKKGVKPMTMKKLMEGWRKKSALLKEENINEPEIAAVTDYFHQNPDKWNEEINK
tara:strand:+ start:411 stop:593 length:183 start_codon:yes stop_codon:yes gene_type:complete